MITLHDEARRGYAYGQPWDYLTRRQQLPPERRTTGSRLLRGKYDHWSNHNEKSIAMKTAKKPAAKDPVSGNGNGHVREEATRKRAYELYEHRGCADGMWRVSISRLAGSRNSRSLRGVGSVLPDRVKL
jgi:hypothetical protein